MIALQVLIHRLISVWYALKLGSLTAVIVAVVHANQLIDRLPLIRLRNKIISLRSLSCSDRYSWSRFFFIIVDVALTFLLLVFVFVIHKLLLLR